MIPAETVHALRQSQFIQTSSLALVLAYVLSVAANCLHGTSFFPRIEGVVPISNFTYSGTRGPLELQSPIVLNNAAPKARSAPILDIPSVGQAEFMNLGTTLEVTVGGTMFFGGQALQLKQFHFHTPSEHRIDHEYFPLEMHLVHQADDGLITVLALLFQLSETGTTTALLTAVAKNLADVTSPGTNTTTGALDFNAVAKAAAAGPLFQYSGSLTTPPCMQGVTFLVLAVPLPLDVWTYNRLKSVLKYNARYTQNALGDTNLLVIAEEAPKLGKGPSGAPFLYYCHGKAR
ncbi:alpha carbonic anhydrase [Mycena rosella]|uniref:Carbonic anhydrase n=1 Tax=Mycena rosella TaxID=1033263 RepID=A0AAD7CR51_MYCRO|nr:alpha carbonic anhydrase [Mycena rosella]